MKASIIGGGGLVGSCTALRAAVRRRHSRSRSARRQRGRRQGQALDLLHGALSLMHDQYFHAGDYADVPTSDFVIITAGLRRKPDESRLDLINRNVALFRQILGDVKKAGLKRRTVVVVSNPVDILTYLAVKELSTCPGSE